MAFSMSLSSAIARCGTVLNYLITPYIAQNYSVFSSCTLGCLMTFLGLGACLVLTHKQKKNDYKQRLGNAVMPKNEIKMYTNINDTPKIIFAKAKSVFEAAKKYADKDTNNNNSNQIDKKRMILGTVINSNETQSQQSINSHDVWNEVISDVKQKKPFSGSITKANQIAVNDNTQQTTENSVHKKVIQESIIEEKACKISDTYSPGFGLLVAISFMFAATWAPFASLASILLQRRYAVTSLYAGRLMAVEEGASLILNILIGSVSDIFGYKLYFVAAGSFLQIVAHFFIFKIYGSPVVPILLISFSGSFISCYWPCITYLVSKEKIAAGFSIFTCVLNVAYTFAPMMVGTLATRDITFDTVEFYMICVGIVTFISILILGVMNTKFKLELNRRSFIK
ncbi:hypothetical protein BDAP_002663 [Binucleata daphniae]